LIKKAGVVAAVIRYENKGEAGRVLDRGVLIKDFGLEGDRHAQDGDRQLSLLSVESRRWMKEQSEEGLCFSRFKENIAVEGLSLEELRPGMRLRLGRALVEITGESKHCHPECRLFSANKICRLSGQSLFARVLRGGVLLPGEEIRIVETKDIK
jgi:MOSC domain-containing protein YiiM